MENPVSLNRSYISSSTNNDNSEIVLETFCHQVGGRSIILTYDRDTVCKPSVPQELRFYLQLPRSLQPFTPHYKGVIKVEVQVIDNEKIQLVTKMKGCIDADVNHNLDKNDAKTEGSEEKDDFSSGKKEVEKKADYAVNPWTFYCHSLYFKTLKETTKHGKPLDFILMEDVVSSFTFPCIMDLKMGDKMHTDYSTQEKYIKQAAKWNASTSKTLGVRIAGIQVYKVKTKKYEYQDKYHGYQQTEQSIKDAFIHFLHNGKHVRKTVVVAFLDKLQQLYTCIKEQKDSRFYSSSLLLIYEGFEEHSTSEGHHNGMAKECDATAVGKPDICSRSEEEMLPTNGIESDIDGKFKSCHTKLNDTKQESSVYETQKHNESIIENNLELSTEKVGVKMIDFARSFHGQAKTTIDPLEDSLDTGPDEGYLLGLNSLIKLLREILMQI